MKRLDTTRLPALDYTATEAVNTLCTNLSFVGKDVKRIMVTSCREAEGKSFLSINILRTMANLGKRVALVDADLRRSASVARYGIRMPDGVLEYGITHFLAGMCDAEEILYSTNIPGAYMSPVGYEVSNSLSLLSNRLFPEFLEYLANQFDFVIVDAPPVGMIIDAAEIAKSCDGTLFVVDYNKVSRRELQDAKQQIERSGCPVLGAVLNNVTFDSYTSKKYYNKYYHTRYSKESSAKPTSRRKKARRAE